MSNAESDRKPDADAEDDDEPDDWWVSMASMGSKFLLTALRDKRIFSTGCAGTIVDQDRV